MSWFGVGFSAFNTISGALGARSAAKAQEKFQRKQAEYNYKQGVKSSRIQGMHLDTNIVRSRIETQDALVTIEGQAAEAEAMARVQGAAAGQVGGSYETVLNSFARKTNKAESNVTQQLIASLVDDKLTREQVGIQATNGQSVVQGGSTPSMFGAILGGLGNFFSQTQGLSFGNLFGGSGGGNGMTASESNNASTYAPNFTNTSTGYSRISGSSSFTE
jgi:hypothetical protein